MSIRCLSAVFFGLKVRFSVPLAVSCSTKIGQLKLYARLLPIPHARMPILIDTKGPGRKTSGYREDIC